MQILPVKPLRGVSRKVSGVVEQNLLPSFQNSNVIWITLQIALLFMCLSAVAWIVIVAGFIKLLKE